MESTCLASYIQRCSCTRPVFPVYLVLQTETMRVRLISTLLHTALCHLASLFSTLKNSNVSIKVNFCKNDSLIREKLYALRPAQVLPHSLVLRSGCTLTCSSGRNTIHQEIHPSSPIDPLGFSPDLCTHKWTLIMPFSISNNNAINRPTISSLFIHLCLSRFANF